MLIEILFIVFWVLGLVFFWSGGPWGVPNAARWGWAPHLYYLLMFALTGLALFNGLGIGREVLR